MQNMKAHILVTEYNLDVPGWFKWHFVKFYMWKSH